MAQQLLLETQFDDNGDPLAGALAYVYLTGTTTPVTVYSDTGLTTPHAQPIVANAAVLFAQAFYSGASALKVVYKTAAGVTRYTRDPAPLASISTSEAADVSFTPATGISSTDVQSAVEEVYGAITDTTANQNILTQTGGSGNAYTLAAPTTISAYAAGQKFLIRINHQNTGPATLNVDGVGAVALKVYFGNALSDPPAGSLQVGDVYNIAHDGTRFVIVNRTDRIAVGTIAAPVAALDFDIPGIYRAVRITVSGFTHNAGADRNLAYQLGTGTAASPVITATGHTTNSVVSFFNSAPVATGVAFATMGLLSAGEGGTVGQNTIEATISGLLAAGQSAVSLSATVSTSTGVTTGVIASFGATTLPTVLRILLSGSGSITGGSYLIEGMQ